ncbi:hypothetical protein [Chthonomonas calidirosea]|uniref:hypothetical protein n=1 Tax=Chthonomonas calidirosea TaxID=454171 RepID=UPI0006EC6869|nr:hypothetical protein [Chthonomonas calidirosea]CEK15416.1 hypothetical protein CP488_01161 [Chthonomonas calidirosea]
MLHELIGLAEFTKLCVVVAVATPIVALVWAVARPPHRHKAVLLALLGPANLALWVLYNRITNRFGLDTVRNLAINVGLFVTLGVLGGIGYGLLESRWPKDTRPDESREAEP